MGDFVFDAEMDAVLADYIRTIADYDDVASARGEMERDIWRSEMTQVDRARREKHNAAARLAMTLGYIPRRPHLPAEDELAAARHTVVDMVRKLRAQREK